MNAADLRRMRFAYSPLAEVTESLCLLRCGRITEQYRGWFETIRGRLQGVDIPLLRTVLPPWPEAPRFMFLGATDPGTTIERQLELVAGYPADQLRQDLSEAWRDTGPP